MSIDFDWSALDAELTQSAIDFLASAFASAPRPSFLGPIEVSSFSFGDAQPEVELLDITDVYKEFLEVDDDELLNPAPEPTPPPRNERRTSTSRDRLRRSSSRDGAWRHRSGHEHHSQDELSLQGGGFGRSESVRGFGGGSTMGVGLRSSLSRPQTSTSLPSLHPSSALFSPGLNTHGLLASRSRMNSRSPSPAPTPFESPTNSQPVHHPSPPPSSSATSTPDPPSSTPQPSLQMHLRVTYTGNLTVGLATSLLINYPSPMFMSLPLKLALTSVAFRGTFLVAFEGDRRRIHLSILDPRTEVDGLGGGVNGAPLGAGLTAGARLLTGAVVESEVGEGEKHVLKNVGKVEKFVLDVARSTLQSEMVFP